jgi:hypothetical protein
VFKLTFARWIGADEHDLAHFVRNSFTELKALTAG